MTAEENNAVVLRYIEEVWNQHNLDGIDELVSPEYLNHAATFYQVVEDVHGLQGRRPGCRSGSSWPQPGGDRPCRLLAGVAGWFSDVVLHGGLEERVEEAEGSRPGRILALRRRGEQRRPVLCAELRQAHIV
jgi:hypothetical protein